MTLSAASVIATNNFTSPPNYWTNVFDGSLLSCTTGTIGTADTASFMLELGTNMDGVARMTIAMNANPDSIHFSPCASGPYPHPVFVAGVWKNAYRIAMAHLVYGAAWGTNTLYFPVRGRYLGGQFYNASAGSAATVKIFEIEVMGRNVP